jgi:hypothetical protein
MVERLSVLALRAICAASVAARRVFFYGEYMVEKI